MPAKLIKNRIFESLVALTVLYWILASITPRYLVFEAGGALTLSVALGIVVAYAPGAWRSMRVPWSQTTSSHFITVGIWIFWLKEAAQRSWSLVYRWLDRPDWMVDHLFSGYLLVLGVVAAVFHVVSKDPREDYFARSNMRMVGVIVALSVLALFVTLRVINIDPPSTMMGGVW